jgi:hypothetical protein
MGLRGEELDAIFDEFTLIAECVDRFSDWTIEEKIESVRREALLEVARRCLDGASEMASDFVSRPSRPSRPFLNPPDVSTPAVGDISVILL